MFLEDYFYVFNSFFLFSLDFQNLFDAKLSAF